MCLCRHLSTVLLELPVSIVERAHLSCLEPSRDAVKVEGVIADSPGDRAFFARSGSLICLALDAEVHDVISADGAVVDDNVPGPKSYGVPLLDLEALLVTLGAGTGLGHLCLCRGRISHVDVGHGCELCRGSGAWRGLDGS